MYKRVNVRIYGTVQGVGFRYYTVHKARHLGLTGWVKNNYDGSVHAVFEGPVISVDEMLDWCRNGPPAAHVTDVKIENELHIGEFQEFKIIH